MKKLTIFIIVAVLLTGVCLAYELNEVSKMSVTDIQNLLGGKYVSAATFKVSRTNGNIFILARDPKTRNLEWYLINPFAKKVLKHGNCPFKGFNNAVLSPDCTNAIVDSRYPGGIWHLTIGTAQWDCVYTNPAEGLAFSSLSPLTYINNSWVMSVVDDRDKDKVVKDSFIVSFTPSPFTMLKVASLNKLKQSSAEKFVSGKLPKDRIFIIDEVRYGSNNTFVYVIKSNIEPESSKHVDFLAFYSNTADIKLLDKQEGEFYPLDFQPEPFKVLYRSFTKGKSQVMLYSEDKKIPLMEAKATVGKIMKGNVIGIAAVKGSTFTVYIGGINQKFTPVLSLPVAYAAGFTDDGEKLILINDKEVRCFKIVK